VRVIYSMYFRLVNCPRVGNKWLEPPSVAVELVLFREGEGMNQKLCLLTLCVLFLIATAACTKAHSAAPVIVKIPSGFSGNFVLEMGVISAPPLEKRGDAYVIAVPKDRKVVTSTILTDSRPAFQNASNGAVWGYSNSVVTAGDGIAVGGKVEFFVGTQKEFEAERTIHNF
jgi:hypothetical protein